MLRLRIICNPNAAAGRRGWLLDAVLERLNAQGAAIELLHTTRAGDAARFVREAQSDTTDRIVIAGGDGTINDALQGFRDGSPPCAILPVGTANVLAHELGLKPLVSDLTDYLLHGQPQPVFAGRVNAHRFLSVASAGSDARAVADLPRVAKKRLGKLAYLIFGIRSFVRHGSPAFQVKVDGQSHMVSLVIANRGRRYGGNHILAPSASMSDPKLVVTLMPPAGRTRTFLRLSAIAFGLARNGRFLPQTTCDHLEIPSPEGAPVQGDGDVIEHLPARISVDTTPILLVSPG